MPAYKTTAIRVNAVTRPGRWLDARSHINASDAANVNTTGVANKEWQPHPIDLARNRTDSLEQQEVNVRSNWVVSNEANKAGIRRAKQAGSGVHDIHSQVLALGRTTAQHRRSPPYNQGMGATLRRIVRAAQRVTAANFVVQPARFRSVASVVAEERVLRPLPCPSKGAISKVNASPSRSAVQW